MRCPHLELDSESLNGKNEHAKRTKPILTDNREGPPIPINPCSIENFTVDIDPETNLG